MSPPSRWSSMYIPATGSGLEGAMTTITISPNGRNFYDQTGPATELLVGTADGIVVMTRADAGSPWQEARRALTGNHIESLVVEPSRGAIFAGTGHAGVWAS